MTRQCEELVNVGAGGFVQGQLPTGLGVAQIGFCGETLFADFSRTQACSISSDSRYNSASKTAIGKRNPREWETIQSLVERALELESLPEEELAWEPIRDRLFRLLRPQLYQMVRALVRDPHAAEDITQGALLKIWHRLTLYNPKLAPFRVWVSRVVINLTYNAIRGYNRTAQHEIRESDLANPDCVEEPLSFFDTATNTDPDPSEQVSDRERLELILTCAREVLSADEYLVWWEQMMNGSSYQEIAGLLVGKKRGLGTPDDAARPPETCSGNHSASQDPERRGNPASDYALSAIGRTAERGGTRGFARRTAPSRGAETARLATD